MKKLFSLLALVLSFSISLLPAEARKKGVGHTFDDVVPGEHIGGNVSAEIEIVYDDKKPTSGNNNNKTSAEHVSGGNKSDNKKAVSKKENKGGADWLPDYFDKSKNPPAWMKFGHGLVVINGKTHVYDINVTSGSILLPNRVMIAKANRQMPLLQEQISATVRYEKDESGPFKTVRRRKFFSSMVTAYDMEVDKFWMDKDGNIYSRNIAPVHPQLPQGEFITINRTVTPLADG